MKTAKLVVSEISKVLKILVTPRSGINKKAAFTLFLQNNKKSIKNTIVNNNKF